MIGFMGYSNAVSARTSANLKDLFMDQVGYFF